MRRYLHTEAAWLVDKHIGRARADFQARLEQLGRDLRSAASRLYTQRQSQLRLALDTADRDRGDHSAADSAATVTARLTALAEDLDQLLGTGGRSRS